MKMYKALAITEDGNEVQVYFEKKEDAEAWVAKAEEKGCYSAHVAGQQFEI